MTHLYEKDMICFNCYTEFHPTLSKPFVQIVVCAIDVEISHVFIMT